MKLSDAKHIYMIGIGGIGMSALARLFLKMGKQVSGSDLKFTQITKDLEKLGAKIYQDHDTSNFDQSVNLVIYTDAVSKKSEGRTELVEANKRSLPVLNYSKALGLLMQGHHGIAITGTNGKSTTAAMLALMLEAAELDPMVALGSQVTQHGSKFEGGARFGQGKYFVAEADEFHRHMMDTDPRMIILTNIEEDHLDYYKDIHEIRSAFIEYVKKLQKEDIIIYSAEDKESIDVGRASKSHKFTYGIKHYADLRAIDIEKHPGKQTFKMQYMNEVLGEVAMYVPGNFNILNALGASLAAIKLGVSFEVIKKVLGDFKGTWRRFETVGKLGATTIISDYGHHPTGIEFTLASLKEFYPRKKVLAVFQPHQRSRTKTLFQGFVNALSQLDEVIIPELFDVSGREQGEQISSKDLVEALQKIKIKALYTKDLMETEKLVREKAKDYDIILFMGAGDIDETARILVKKTA